MGYRKGELTPAGVDLGWPHQVARLHDLGTGKQGDVIHAFCKDLSLCVRGHRVVWENDWYNIYCFAQREHAEAFMAQFGGELFDPRERGRGHKWHFWYKGKFANKPMGR
jgi:hypothetical protein